MRFLLGVLVGAAITLTASEQFPELKALATHYVDRVTAAPAQPALDEVLPPIEAPATPAPASQSVWADETLETPPPIEVRQSPSEPVASKAMTTDTTTTNPPAEPIEVPSGFDVLASAQRATIWTPFHSENSAKGFAGMLTREIGREFQVDRESAGRYQVTFAYDDDTDRGLISEQVMAITGWARVEP